MTPDKALTLAIKALEKEKSRYRQFYSMFNIGFVNERPGAKKYIDLEQAIATLQYLQSRLVELNIQPTDRLPD
jgi:hypothetical protein